VDGETLLMLASSGTMEMMTNCGLITIKQQLLLRTLIESIKKPESSSPVDLVDTPSKPSRAVMKKMPEDIYHLYKIK